MTRIKSRRPTEDRRDGYSYRRLGGPDPGYIVYPLDEFGHPDGAMIGSVGKIGNRWEAYAQGSLVGTYRSRKEATSALSLVRYDTRFAVPEVVAIDHALSRLVELLAAAQTVIAYLAERGTCANSAPIVAALLRDTRAALAHHREETS